MASVASARYGKDNVRVYKVERDEQTGVQTVTEMTVCVLLEGAIDVSYAFLSVADGLLTDWHQVHQGRQQCSCSYRLNEEYGLHKSQRAPSYSPRTLRQHSWYPLHRNLPPPLRRKHQDHYTPLDPDDDRWQATPTLLLS